MSEFRQPVHFRMRTRVQNVVDLYYGVGAQLDQIDIGIEFSFCH